MMSFLMNFIPVQYQVIAKIIMYVLIASACAYGGHSLTKSYYQPRVELLELKAQQFEDAYSSLAETTNKQNTAILKLQQEGITKQKKAEIALEKAKRDSNNLGNEANLIMLTKPKGTDTCKEASALIDSELAKERN